MFGRADRDDVALDLRRPAGEVARGARRVARDVDRARELDRLAVVERLDLRELVAVRLDQLGELRDPRAAVGGAHRAPRRSPRRTPRAPRRRPRRRRRRRPARRSAIGWPVAGSSVSNVAPSAAATHSPPISSRCSRSQNARASLTARRAGLGSWPCRSPGLARLHGAVCQSAALTASARSSAPRARRTARRPPAPVVERHVMRDERRGVELAAGEQLEHRVEVADHVRVPGLASVSALIQARPMWTSHALGVDADDADACRTCAPGGSRARARAGRRRRRPRRRRRGPRSPP